MQFKRMLVPAVLALLLVAPALAETPASYTVGNKVRAITVPSVISDFDEVPTAVRNELLCLSTAVFYEGSHQHIPDEHMVAHVTMNRLENGEFGVSLCHVLFRKGSGYGFAHQHRRSKIPDCAAWTRNQQIALAVYRHEEPDPTGGRLHFQDGKRLPKWAKRGHYKPIWINPHLVY